MLKCVKEKNRRLSD